MSNINPKMKGNDRWEPKKTTTKKAPNLTAKKVIAKKAEKLMAKKISQIEAAAKFSANAKEPMNCKVMVEAIQAKGFWNSSGGRTPEATLYASIIRDIAKRGKILLSRRQKGGRLLGLARLFRNVSHTMPGNGRFCLWLGGGLAVEGMQQGTNGVATGGKPLL
jgi:hypothetical protein